MCAGRVTSVQCETKWITLVREHGQFFMNANCFNANLAAEQLNCVVLVVKDCTSSSIIWNDKRNHQNKNPNRDYLSLFPQTNYFCLLDPCSEFRGFITLLYREILWRWDFNRQWTTFFFLLWVEYISSLCVHDALPHWTPSPLACGICHSTSSWRHGPKPGMDEEAVEPLPLP